MSNTGKWLGDIPGRDNVAIGGLVTLQTYDHGDEAIDNQSYHNAVLSAAEIQWLYNSGDGRSYSDLIGNQGGADVPDTADLVSWWKHEELSGTRQDIHGGTNMADVNGVSATDGIVAEYAGAQDRALRLVASSTQYADVNTAIVSAYPLSIAVWFKTTDTTERVLAWIGDKDVPNEYQAVLISATGEVIARSSSTADGTAEARTAAGYNDGEWHLAIARYVLATSRGISVDGLTFVDNATAVTIGAAYDRTSFGRSGDTVPGASFDGDLDEGMVFDLELIDIDASEMYFGGVGTLASAFSTGSPLTSGKTPQAGYSFNDLNVDGAGADVLGTNDLTLHNGPTGVDGIPAGQTPSQLWRLLDRTPNATHLHQPTLNKRPIFRGEFLNQEPAMQFDAVAQTMLTAALWPATSQPNTIGIVARVDTALGCYLFDGAEAGSLHSLRRDASVMKAFAGTDAVTADDFDATWAMYFVVFNGASVAVYKNGGANLAAGQDCGAQALTGLVLAASYQELLLMEGFIAEQFVNDGAMTTTELNDIGQQWQTVYGINYTPIT